MKKYLSIFIAFFYFSVLYILKEGFLNSDLTHFLNTYINLEKIYYVSFIFGIIFILTSIIEKVFKRLTSKQEKKSISKHILPILKKFIQIFIWIFWIITVISNLWYNVGALLTWAGIWWLAIALAAQKTIWNIFWAISIILNTPFKIWDFIAVGNYTGTVKDIGLTYLKLLSSNGNEILIPNETVISSSIENLTLRENRRVDFSVGVTYDTSVEKLKKAIETIESILQTYKLGNKNDKIVNFRVHFDNFWDFSLNILWTYFTSIDDILEHNKLKEEINIKIKETFEKHKIDIAFPTQTIYLQK